MTKIPSFTISPPATTARSYRSAVRTIERHRGPVIVTAFGSQLYNATAAARAKRGDVLRFDPFALAGEPSHTWSPLDRARSFTAAIEVSWNLVLTGQREQRGIDGPHFWGIVAEQQLAPLLYAAACDQRGIEDVVAWAYGQRRSELNQILMAHEHLSESVTERRDTAAAANALRLFAKHPDRTRISAEATVQALLRAYRFTRVCASAHGCEISADRLLSADNTLYLISDGKAAKLLRPLMTALLAELANRAVDRTAAQAASRRRTTPLLLADADDGKVGTMPTRAAHDLATGRLQAINVPDPNLTAANASRRRRRLRFRAPVTLS